MNPLKHSKGMSQVELAEFIEQLQNQIPKSCEGTTANCDFIEEYRRIVALTFGANVLFKGVSYANRLHNHVVHVYYVNSFKSILQEELSVEETKKLLLRLKKEHNKLLQRTFTGEETKGVTLFFQFVGGNKKKQRANQQTIFRFYVQIKQRALKNLVRVCWELMTESYRHVQQKKAYILWQLKSYTWK